MHNIMYAKNGVKYFNEANFPPFRQGEKPINVIKIAEKRKKIEKAYNLDMGYNYPGFWYLDYSILIELLDLFWDQFFCEIFINYKQIKQDVMLRLKNIISIRNAIAHHRYISNIDLSDLLKTAEILYKYLDKTRLNNFNSVSLSTAEENLKKISASLQDIKRDLTQGNCIVQKKLDNFQTMLSAFLIQRGRLELLSQEGSITKIIEEYNKLPRKPGRGKEIKEFLKNRGLIEKINDLFEKVGG